MKTYPKRAIKADSGESTMLNRDSMGVTVALPRDLSDLRPWKSGFGADLMEDVSGCSNAEI